MIETSLRELECFTAVAEELSFTRAAQRLHLSQPPLSRHVATLEARLGAQLFERTKRRVRLTAAGELFLNETRGVLAQIAQAEHLVRSARWSAVEPLRVGFVSALLSAQLVERLLAYRAEASEVRLSLVDETPARQMELLRGGELELGFIGLKPASQETGITFHPWRRERLCAVYAADRGWPPGVALSMNTLTEEPLVFVGSEAAPDFVSLLHRLCASSGFKARVVQEASRAQAVALMAATGAGVALLPESVAQAAPGIAAAPLVDTAGEAIWLELVVATQPRLSAAGEAFLSHMVRDSEKI